MFAGLMSLWTIPLECAAFSPSATLMATFNSPSSSMGATGDDVLQDLAFQKLPGDERSAVFLTDVIDRTNIRMVERRSCLRLSLKPRQRLRVLRYIVGRNFNATLRCRRVSSALYTTPIPPSPNLSRMR